MTLIVISEDKSLKAFKRRIYYRLKVPLNDIIIHSNHERRHANVLESVIWVPAYLP